jgi:hypothetical protein
MGVGALPKRRLTSRLGASSASSMQQRTLFRRGYLRHNTFTYAHLRSVPCQRADTLDEPKEPRQHPGPAIVNCDTQQTPGPITINSLSFQSLLR